jgi:hypothetical protein
MQNAQCLLFCHGLANPKVRTGILVIVLLEFKKQIWQQFEVMWLKMDQIE